MPQLFDVDKDSQKFPEDKGIRLNLGCGQARIPGFIGVDLVPGPAVDVICDLEIYPWRFINADPPLPCDEHQRLYDNSILEVQIHHYLEHVTDLISFANELYRVMVPGGKIKIVSPYYSSVRASQDPTHKQWISENTFVYWHKQWREANGISHYPFTCNFWGVYKKFTYDPDFEMRSDTARDYARKHIINSVMDIEIGLEAKK